VCKCSSFCIPYDVVKILPPNGLHYDHILGRQVRGEVVAGQTRYQSVQWDQLS
jgi:hypothetical protein